MIDNLTKFRPVVGVEENIKNLSFNEGWVYFASDTGKIFLDVDGERVTMGGSGASLFYFEEDKVVELPNGAYQLRLSTMLDGQDPNAIKEIDLIINTTTESFYRVSSVDQDAGIVEAELLTVGGGSGGSGGGGGGGEGSTTSIKIDVLDPPAKDYVYGQDSYARFVVTASDDDLVTLIVEITNPDLTKTTENHTILNGQEITVNIGKLMKIGNSKLVIRAFGENSGTAAPKTYISRNTIQLRLIESSSFNPLAIQTGDASIQYRIEGSIQKTVICYVDNIPVASADYAPTITGTTQAIVIPSGTVNHGVHNVRLVLSAIVSGNTVVADPLEYEMAWAEEGETTPIIWFPYGYKTKIENYDDYVVEYRVYNPLSEQSEMHIYRNGVQIPISPLTVNSQSTSVSTQKLALTDYELGTNIYLMTVGSASKELSFEVVESTSRDMNIDTAGLVLNLDSTGRSNSENIQNREIWKYQDIQVQLNNFNWYNNGWIMDENGRSCLRISNGASIRIPIPNNLNILNSISLYSSLTFEFRFKVRNIREYSTLILRNTNYTYSEDASEAESQTGGLDPTLSSVVGKFFNSSSTGGLLIGTQEAVYTTGTSTVSARYKEDEIITLSFVIEKKEALPLIHIYINGIDSGITTYPSNTSFDIRSNAIVFDSTVADIDLYKVRIYRRDLSSADIAKNYIVDIKDVNTYDVNQNIIQYRSGESVPYLDYEKLVAYNNNIINNETVRRPELLTEPYVVVKTIRDPAKPQLTDYMPYYKGDKTVVNVKFVNPYLDYLWDNRENGVNNPLTNAPITAEEYLTSCPSFNYITTEKGIEKNVKGKGQLNVQGTSSQGYPRRNYKWKASLKDKDTGEQLTEWTYIDGPLVGESLWKKKTIEGSDITFSKWFMDTKLVGSSTFCWKADYMESSSSYNTGMANFVKTLYNKHPLEDYSGRAETNASLLRTTVYGFPFLLFQEKQDGSYEYLGRYNFNLDKDSNERYGFEDEGNSFVKDPTNPAKFLPFSQVAECWEFEHNRGGFCSAKNKNFREFDPEKGTYSFLEAFDYRYNPNADAMDDILEDATLSNDEKLEYWLGWTEHLQEVLIWLADLDCDGLSDDIPEEAAEKQEKLSTFKREFNEWFDLEYCEIYFICTELFHMYDSRGKNMMWATWGPHEEGGNYIWYPIFYDMDTMFGLNNTGSPTWDYDVNPTEQGHFSTSNHTLWQNLWACYAEDIKQKYRTLVDDKDISYDALAGYFNFNPKITKSIAMEGQRPINSINLDEFYKYIAPSHPEYGFINTSGNKDTTSRFYYCLQGTRKLQQELYFRNRLNFLNSKWEAGDYDRGNVNGQYQARYNANTAKTSDTYLYDPEKIGQTVQGDDGVLRTYSEIYPMPLDTDPTYRIRTFLKQYASVYYDASATSLQPSDSKNPVTLPPRETDMKGILSTANSTQQLVYLGGAEYIATLGDISKHYVNEINLSQLSRIEEVLIGSDEPGYYNDLLHDADFHINESTSKPKSLLKKVVLTGLRSLISTIDLETSEKMEEFRALNTKIFGVTFAPGVQIHTLHLPKTVGQLILTEPVALDTLLTERPVSNERGLYIENITDNINNSKELDTISLNTLSIIGGALGYNSYKILNTVTAIKEVMINNGEDPVLSINLENVNWSPYRQITSGEIYISADAANYKRLNGHYQLENYTYNADTWDDDVVNGNIYLYNNAVYQQNSNVITNLDLLDLYIDSYIEAVNYFNTHDEDKSKNHYKNTSTSATIPTMPVITGLMYVENGLDAIGVDEERLSNKYNEYFPELTIICNKVKKGYTTEYINIDDSGKEVVFEKQVISENDLTSSSGPIYPSANPTKSNYVFEGWSLSKTGDTILTREQVEAYRYSSSNRNYTFYSIWRIQSFNIRFLNPDNDNLITEYQADYGTFLHDPNVLPYSTREGELQATERYTCIGWVLDKNNSYPRTMSEAKVNLLTLSAIMSQNNDRTYYACFLKEDCRTSPTDSKFFKFDQITGLNECVCSPADGAVLQGKITIPTVYNGMTVVELSGFGSGYMNINEPQQITHVYWYNTNGVSPQLKRIGDSAFRNCINLVYIDIPDTVEIIYQYAFAVCKSLEMIDFSNLKRLETIGNSAFNGAFGKYVGINLHFAGKTKNFGQYSFAYLNSTNLGELKFGDGDDPVSFTDDITMAAQSFVQGTGFNFQTVIFYYNPSITRKETALEPLFSATYMNISGATPSYIDVTTL